MNSMRKSLDTIARFNLLTSSSCILYDSSSSCTASATIGNGLENKTKMLQTTLQVSTSRNNQHQIRRLHVFFSDQIIWLYDDSIKMPKPSNKLTQDIHETNSIHILHSARFKGNNCKTVPSLVCLPESVG